MMLGSKSDSSNGGGGGGGGVTLKKGPWSATEDAILVDYVKKYGEGNWNAVQRNTSLLRCGKSCRLRWANHLRPNLKKGAFTPEEERLIIELHAKLGNKWARISAHVRGSNSYAVFGIKYLVKLPGRTDNEVKNYWNTRVKRRMRQGLPLYPHEIRTGPSSFFCPPPSPPSPLTHFRTPPTSVSLFNPISLACPTPFFPLHSTTIISPPSHPKLPMQNSFAGQSGSALLAQTESFHLNTMSFNFESPSILRTHIDKDGFDPFGSVLEQNSELPSNQLCEKMSNENINDERNINSNMGRSNSGLLDALLQEARDRGESKKLKREHSDYGAYWKNSGSEKSISCCGLVKNEEQEHQLSPMNEDLSSILDLIPSLVQVPECCNDGREASIGHSSDDSVGLEITQDLTIPAASRTEDDEWKTVSYTWDNLPRIC
ncbi:hypothetical protein Ancab_025182 [Ancistrocladus abbreviatus]